MHTLNRTSLMGVVVLVMCLFSETAQSVSLSKLSSDQFQSIEQVLADIDQLTVPSEALCQKLSEPFRTLFTTFGRARFSETPVRYCKPFRINEFCIYVGEKCRAIEPSSRACWRSLSADNAAFRADNPTLQKQIFSKAKAFFHRVTHDRLFVNRCCQGDLSCEEKFRKTQLTIIRGLPHDDQTALYNMFKHAVFVSSYALLNAFNEELNERLIMHELGHACQASRHSVTITAVTENFDPYDDLVASLGQEKASCIKNGLTKELETTSSPTANWREWLKEAYADSIFSFEWNDLAHWAWSCAGSRDYEHPPLHAYGHCLFEKSLLLNNFCGGV